MKATEDQGNLSGRSPEIITLGGGCFWCLEAVFGDVQGVVLVESGYSGGSVAEPSYEQVCSGRTGHAEVVQITFEPKAISLGELLEIFFTVHNPTTLNRQGSDIGTQYRSVIFYRDEVQKAAAEQAIAEKEASGIWKLPIVTEVTPFTAFYKAEKYHERYFERNGQQPYCQVVIAPKMEKFREHYRSRLKR